MGADEVDPRARGMGLFVVFSDGRFGGGTAGRLAGRHFEPAVGPVGSGSTTARVAAGAGAAVVARTSPLTLVETARAHPSMVTNGAFGHVNGVSPGHTVHFGTKGGGSRSRSPESLRLTSTTHCSRGFDFACRSKPPKAGHELARPASSSVSGGRERALTLTAERPHRLPAPRQVPASSQLASWPAGWRRSASTPQSSKFYSLI